MKKLVCFAAVCAWCWAVPAVQAGILATYDFTTPGGGAPPTVASVAGVVESSAAPMLSVEAIARSAGLTAQPRANAISSSGWSTGGLMDNDYYSFAVTPTNAVLHLQSIEFTHRSLGNGPNAMSVRSSLDGFASNLFSLSNISSSSSLRSTVALGDAFQALSGSVEFRIYGYDARSASGEYLLGAGTGGDPNNLIINGDLTPAGVPEPTTTAVFGLAALVGAGAAWRRRRKS